jgi:hypothetical protein
MRVETRTDAVQVLEKANDELQSLSRTTESGIESVARAFEGLAGNADTVLNLAGAIVGCVEKESVSSILPKVQTLGAAARRFIGDRLQATTGIVQTVATEVKLLRQVSLVTGSQTAIAFETKALSVLTNIEVARLGAVGADFQYLARELADFSKSLTEDTRKLVSHTDRRKAAVEETNHVLAAELPRLREALARIEIDLGNAVARVDSSLTQLSRTPMQFRGCVEDVAQQITGVVAAVQANDITRQQIEHVQEAFAIISAKLCSGRDSQNEIAEDIALAYAGLTIQIYQLRTIKETLANWASQIRTCMDGILRVSVSDVVGIAPMVLDQERELSSQLGQIEGLERESQAYSERIQRTFGGLTNLMQLVTEHLQRSKSVRDHLQLLTFNSIIEASRLGAQAAAILAIANCIKQISADWGQIADQSGSALQEVLGMVKQTNDLMGAFSGAGPERLREAQRQTWAGLETLRDAAVFAARQAQEMKAATEQMQAKTTAVGNTVDLLDACFGRIDEVLTNLEGVKHHIDIDCPEVKDGFDAAEAERLFSGSYTTEMERDVLRAALSGAELPVAQQTFAGNSVELF